MRQTPGVFKEIFRLKTDLVCFISSEKESLVPRIFSEFKMALSSKDPGDDWCISGNNIRFLREGSVEIEPKT